jgi:hypothetical protein
VWLALDSLERQRGIEAMQVCDVTGDNDRVFTSSDENDRRINDVGRAGAPAQDPRRLREHLVERRHDCGRSFRKSTKRRLARIPAPRLPEHACGDDQARGVLERLANERTHSRVASLECDEGAGV